MNYFTTTVRRVARDASRPDMVWVSSGAFTIGSDSDFPEEAPAHAVQVDGFWIDSTPVTNRQFARFVNATGWITRAERGLEPDQCPGADGEGLQPGSTVFRKPALGRISTRPLDWWAFVPGASWRRPHGPTSSIKGIESHPVVHVALEDAEAYADWAGVSLPTEAEWEFACRGGLEGKAFAWGDEFRPNGRHMANTWQGQFPFQNTAEDGFEGTSPVGAFAPNGYGLYDMIGNVWEWTGDFWSDHAATASASRVIEQNPIGGEEELSFDPAETARTPRRVIKGGSHLSAPNYCRGYRPAARRPQPVDLTTSHLGFRCVLRH